ncbi:MAG: hypothetical protein NXH75_16425 [Halobacteriovoraceae bacterium]|nr:hypothetical protein [Halobacteriovoraceae bacterium]
MKTLLSLSTMAILFVINAQATTSLENAANKICNLALLCEGFKTETNTPKEMIFEYAEAMDGEAPLEYETKLPVNRLPDGDDVVWGRMSMKQALQFVRTFVDPEYGTITKETADKINKQIIKMIGTGVEFGFTPSTGGHVCGSVWPGLLIMDPKTKQVWDIGLFGYPEC